jgi:UDP-N-acetylmuramoyl-tripeptide--D-alanyl-D-alanine ligase
MSALWTSDEAAAATLGHASAVFSATGMSIDTRTLKPGDLFVALKGDVRDGHDFVRAAFDAKASAALVSHKPDGTNGSLLTVAHVQRGLEDLARAARARRSSPSPGVPEKQPRKKCCGWLSVRSAIRMLRHRPITTTGACP